MKLILVDPCQRFQIELNRANYGDIKIGILYISSFFGVILLTKINNYQIGAIFQINVINSWNLLEFLRLVNYAKSQTH